MSRRPDRALLSALALILVTCSCTTAGEQQSPSRAPSVAPSTASASPTPRLSAPGTPSSGPRGAATPGSAEYGDPRFPRSGNGGYEVESYALDISYEPESNELRSTARLSANVTSPTALVSFNLDLQPSMRVTAVEVNGLAAEFDRDEAELIITPTTQLAPQSAIQVAVEYSGRPRVVRGGRSGAPDGGWYQTESGGAYAAGQPISASAWYPVNEHPGDTATFAVTANVPDGWQVISNGLEQTKDLPEPGRGRSVFRWQLDQPIASYLSTIYIDKFTTIESELPDGTPIVSAIGPGVEGAEELARQTAPVIDVLSSYFGPYPFAATGGIFPGESSTTIDLETATRPIYSGASQQGVSIVVHELAHEWFGNSVTLKRWSDICINECFASYAEWLYKEKVDGTDLDARWERQMRRNSDDPEYWQSPLVGMPADEIFTSVYVRGPLALHALRNEVGDEQFFTMLERWPATYAGKHASFDDFEAFASSTVGRDLRPFIDAWFRGTRLPAEDVRSPGDLGQ